MTIKLDGTTELYRWDTKRRVIIECNEPYRYVHFVQGSVVKVVRPYVEDGVTYADIPNVLLEQARAIIVYLFNESTAVASMSNLRTIASETLVVVNRAKPPEYVYEATGTVTIQDYILEALGMAHDSGEFDGRDGTDGGYYTPYVAEDGTLQWLASKSQMPPIEITNIRGPKGETGETGEKGETGERGATGNSGVYIGAEQPIDTEVKVWIKPNGNTAVLYIRNVSGMFVEVPALKGTDGHTPRRGIDYWTEADEQQMRDAVNAAEESKSKAETAMVEAQRAEADAEQAFDDANRMALEVRSHIDQAKGYAEDSAESVAKAKVQVQLANKAVSIAAQSATDAMSSATAASGYAIEASNSAAESAAHAHAVPQLQEDMSNLTLYVDTNKTNLESLDKLVGKLQAAIDNMDTEAFTYYHTIGKDEVTGNYLLTLWQVKDDVEQVASQTILPTSGGGGGGGGGSTTQMTINRITPSPFIITTNDRAIIEIDFSSVDASGETTDAAYTWKSGNNVVMSGSLSQGYNSFDLSEFVFVGTQKLTLTASDESGAMVLKTWTIQKVDIRLETSFNDRYANDIGRAVTFTYTPYGSVSKDIHFKLDDVESTVTTTASGTPQSYTIPAQPHGTHMLEAWITASVNGAYVETPHIFKDIIWLDSVPDESGVYKPAIIGCGYRNDFYGKVEARQYDTIPIAYNVFDPSTNYPVVRRYVDGELVGTDTISAPQNVWNFKSDIVGDHTLKIAVRDTEVTIVTAISELGIDVAPVTANLEIDFNPTGITNSSESREWSNEKYHMTVSPNFDWVNGGYRLDENGDPYFLIKSGTRAQFDYAMFGGGIESNPSVIGAEMKLIFKTENVQDAKAVWLSNVETTTTEVDGTSQSTSVGIQMSVHDGWLKTNNASEADVEGEDGADDVAATNTYLYMPYSEEDVIEMDINIDTLNREDSTAKAFVMAYEDGVPSKAYVYDSGDRFYQYDPKPITIGSDYCDVRIYRMKIYSASLSTEDIMRNFIADSRSSSVMLERYDRNSIYYNRETNTYTPYGGEGVLDPERLAPIMPNVKILMLETDHFTTSKKTFVKSTLRCIHASGGKIYEGDPYYDNWKFENGWHSGQGTTSDNYGNSGRNVDFLFNCDGVHKPSDKVNAEAGYISQVTLGYGTEAAHTEKVTDWKGDDGKVALTRTSVPNNFFNLKVNVASSENVNNALLQKRYNDFLPYISPAQKRDERIKNDMEFVPAVLFIRETNPDVSTHNEFLDTEWHFYALGNIGDSKKTDYTRAYDPSDMNEFTIEISDNTKNNATFQTGVFLDENGNRKIETFTIAEDGSPVSVEKPQSFVYPVTLAEWENEKNMRHWALYNEAFDGDHSFEPRYACCGDYRDGKLVNDTTGHGEEQIAINNEVWRAFVRWLITATDEEFTAELDEWCVRSAVEFFYAFTHMYTMMDNRAKNTFWHFAKTGVFRKVTKPVKELLHVYCEKSGNEYVPTADTSINSSKTYYTQYAFDLWDYDNDTALGINNNGELIFPYGKEDTDYNVDGVPASGYVFNGATSVFWCRLRDLLQNEIRSTFSSVAAECFSAHNLITQFDTFQECYPEEIWRLDIQRKYIRTFTGESVDNSKPKHDVQYLRDMMQGRKKYQRRQWIRDQEIYFGTKNLMNTVVGDDNRITFRCFTPTGEDVVVEPDYTLRITPYSDMYISVMFGNGGTQQIRAKGGSEYIVECPLSTMDDTQVTIYGANRIQGLNDLSACYIAANNFSMATKLRKLVLGNTTPGYNNSRLISLTLGNNALLEELDIRNCGALTGSVNLANCNNLLRLYAEGTKLTGVTFATNGKVRVVHLPDTVNTLIMRNLNDLSDFDASLSRLETLTLQGGTLDNLALIRDCIDTLQVLYLYDIDWTVLDTNLLNAMLNLFHSTVTGKVFVSGLIRQQEVIGYARAWPDLAVTYNPESLVTQYLATFLNEDGEELYRYYVDRGSAPPDPIAMGYIQTPTKPSTPQYEFTFVGWDADFSVMLSDRTFTAQYTSAVRTYTVTWYSRPGISLGSVTVEYGSEVVYEGETPTNTSEESVLIYNVFAGWDKSTGCVREDIDVYAIWERAELPPVGKDLKDMTPGEIFAVTSSGRAADYFEMKDHFDLTMGVDFNFTNVESEVLAEEEYFDGTRAITKDVQLFGDYEKSFTLAIDYEFITCNQDDTLVSLFEEDGAEGFRLRYNNSSNIQWGSGSPSIMWGDKEAFFGCRNMRDIVVVRHVAGDKTLHVYASNAGRFNQWTDRSSYAEEVLQFEITRSRDTNTDSKLTLGAVASNTGYTNFANGMIHWCKIWYDDLGESNSKKLANWYHEPLRMEFCGTNRYTLAEDTSKKANASFIANNTLYAKHDRFRGLTVYTPSNIGGWGVSFGRRFCNTRIAEALPIVWQSMLKNVLIPAGEGYDSDVVSLSKCKVYLPSVVELTNTSTATLALEGEYIPWFTNDTSRIAFMGHIIPDDASFYSGNTEPSKLAPERVKIGDVWTHNSKAYICVSQQEIDMYQVEPHAICDSGIGGWVGYTYPYMLRSTKSAADWQGWFINEHGPAGSYIDARAPQSVRICFSI